jgi:hypothetical protein
VFSFHTLIALLPRKINLKSAIFFNFQRASSMFSRLPSRIFQDGLIKLSECCPWASETSGSEAAGFGFGDGGRGWNNTSGGYYTRALPVRSGK